MERERQEGAGVERGGMGVREQSQTCRVRGSLGRDEEKWRRPETKGAQRQGPQQCPGGGGSWASLALVCGC